MSQWDAKVTFYTVASPEWYTNCSDTIKETHTGEQAWRPPVLGFLRAHPSCGLRVHPPVLAEAESGRGARAGLSGGLCDESVLPGACLRRVLPRSHNPTTPPTWDPRENRRLESTPHLEPRLAGKQPTMSSWSQPTSAKCQLLHRAADTKTSFSWLWTVSQRLLLFPLEQAFSLHETLVEL